MKNRALEVESAVFISLKIFKPGHEIMVLFVLHRLILQTRSHPVGIDVWFSVGPFVYFHTLCVRTANALARLRGCAGSPGPSLVAYVISTIISSACSFGKISLDTKMVWPNILKINDTSYPHFLWIPVMFSDLKYHISFYAYSFIMFQYP